MYTKSTSTNTSARPHTPPFRLRHYITHLLHCCNSAWQWLSGQSSGLICYRSRAGPKPAYPALSPSTSPPHTHTETFFNSPIQALCLLPFAVNSSIQLPGSPTQSTSGWLFKRARGKHETLSPSGCSTRIVNVSIRFCRGSTIQKHTFCWSLHKFSAWNSYPIFSRFLPSYLSVLRYGFFFPLMRVEKPFRSPLPPKKQTNKKTTTTQSSRTSMFAMTVSLWNKWIQSSHKHKWRPLALLDFINKFMLKVA